MNAEERLEQTIAKMELAVRDKNGNLTETERMEYVAELLSIAEQRLEELGENE